LALSKKVALTIKRTAEVLLLSNQLQAFLRDDLDKLTWHSAFAAKAPAVRGCMLLLRQPNVYPQGLIKDPPGRPTRRVEAALQKEVEQALLQDGKRAILLGCGQIIDQLLRMLGSSLPVVRGLVDSLKYNSELEMLSAISNFNPKKVHHLPCYTQ
jgi:hypothetical protein